MTGSRLSSLSVKVAELSGVAENFRAGTESGVLADRFPTVSPVESSVIVPLLWVTIISALTISSVVTFVTNRHKSSRCLDSNSGR